MTHCFDMRISKSSASARWHWRPFVSLLTTFSFLLMAISGLVLYVVPKGRVAYWTDWRLFGLSKTQWGDLHIIATLVFFAVSIFHIYLNWRQLVGYLSRKLAGRLKHRRELGVSLLLTFWIALAGVLPHPPFSLLIDLNGRIKDAWVTSKRHEPPFGHAEELALDTFCQKLRIPLAKAMATLRKKRIKLSSKKQRLLDIARANHITPMTLYGMILHLEPKPKPLSTNAGRTLTADAVERRFAGTGIGRKTIVEIAKLTGTTVARMEKRLTQLELSIGRAKPLRAAATKLGLSPLELLKAMLVDGYTPKR
jgi:hypothetical protein